MPDSFTQTTTTGYGNRIADSLKGSLIGLILFVASFGALYWNAGRVDSSTIAKTATEVSSTTVNTDSSLVGKLVSTTGIVNSHQVIGDNLFLQPGNFTVVERDVEMYSWVETAHTSHGKHGSGTTYSYSEGWEENPASSSTFRYPEGHENPQKSLDSSTNKVTAATIGVYNFNLHSIILPNLSQLPLNKQNITLSDGAILANDSYLFIRKSQGGTFDSPQIGDLRISYHVLRPGFIGTIFGTFSGSTIGPYVGQNGNGLYRLFIGTRDQALVTIHTEYITALWTGGLTGFLLMWLGLQALCGPISALLDVLPRLGASSRFLIGVITFLVALVLSIITTLISMLLHSFIALIIVFVVIVAPIITFLVILKNKNATMFYQT